MTNNGKVRALLPVLLLPAAAFAQPEDAAHRTDRLEVQRLNSRSANGYAPARRASASSPDENERAYARAQADYQARLAAWRRRVAACEAGSYDACR